MSPVEKGNSVTRALGEAIRAVRVERGYAQERFAAHAGIDRSYFGAVERGEFNITLATLLKIAAGLDVPAWTLLKRGEVSLKGVK